MGENAEEFKEKLERAPTRRSAAETMPDARCCSRCVCGTIRRSSPPLIDRGCDVNAQNIWDDGADRLRRQSADAARVLLERGADRTIKLTDGDRRHTAADAARRNDHDELAAAIDNFKPGKRLIA